MDKKEIFEELHIISLKNKEIYEFAMKELSRLNIVLLNLKIESSKISEKNGVGVIADELKTIKKNIEIVLKNVGEREIHMKKLLNELRNNIEGEDV